MSNFTLAKQWLAQRPYIIAAVITLALILWMASGRVNSANAIANTNQKLVKTERLIPASQVKVETRHAQRIFDVVELYGRTEPNRIATLKAEVRGKIVAVLAKRGAQVKKGQAIAKIDGSDLSAQLKRNQALLKQREIEYQGAKKLAKKGYQGEVQLAQAFANLAKVNADISQLTLNIERTTIKAPFDGVLNTRYVEVGDYVASGDNVAMVADLNPLIVRAFVTEKQVAELTIGQKADITLLHHQQVQGQLRYIASVGDDDTNTFKIEVAIDNTNNTLFAGLSAELSIPLLEINAIKISPALLALDEQGNVGVKSVQDKTVVFTPINIVKSDADGIWLTGLGEQVDIITLGQGFVRAGDTVEAIFSHDAVGKSSTNAMND